MSYYLGAVVTLALFALCVAMVAVAIFWAFWR